MPHHPDFDEQVRVIAHEVRELGNAHQGELVAVRLRVPAWIPGEAFGRRVIRALGAMARVEIDPTAGTLAVLTAEFSGRRGRT